MSLCKQFVIPLISIITFLPLFGQETYPDCVNPKKITVPLTDEFTLKDQDEIYYQPEDKFTYWYQLNATANSQLSYKLSAISKEDSYEVLIYNFKGTNFCNDVIQKKEKPVETKSEGTIAVKKGETYFVTVLHLNGYGCGHTLSLKTENKTITLKAIQNDCIEDAVGAIVEQITIVEEVKLPEIIKQPVVQNNDIKGIVVNKNSQKNIEAVITLLDKNGNPTQQINSSVDSGFVLHHPIEKKVAVAINKFGYEIFSDTLDLIDNNIKIELTPIKIGDKLIMYKIYFHPNTYVLKEESKKELLKLTIFMLENNNYSFEIQGHTNGNKTVKKTKNFANLGEEWNFKGTAKKLSKMRAEKIKTYLVENGVKETQLQTIGYGGDRMIIEKPKNMKQAMQNIRVEVIVIQ